jgi:hypothetical protein
VGAARTNVANAAARVKLFPNALEDIMIDNDK